MKRVISILLALVMLLMFIGCDKDEPQTGGEKTTQAEGGEASGPATVETTPGSTDKTPGTDPSTGTVGTDVTTAVTTTGSQPDAPETGHKHTFGEWASVKDAECTSGASKERVCSCGYKETVYSSPPGHKIKNNICEVCGAKASENLAFAEENGSYKLTGIGSCKDTDIVVPDIKDGKPVTKVADNAFEGNRNIKTLTLPEGVVSVGNGSFKECSSLYRVYLPESLNTIGKYAFDSCTDLMSVTVPKNVTAIGSEAFFACYKLIEVCNLSGVSAGTKSKSGGHVGYYALSVTKQAPDHLFCTGDGYWFFDDGNSVYLLGYLGKDTELVLPETLNGKEYDIYRAAFYQNTKLKSVAIAQGTKKIGSVAFSGCSALASVSVPKSIKTVDTDAFKGCDSLKTVFYAGSSREWISMINFESGNNALAYATVTYAE